jgi:hypothetical protein
MSETVTIGGREFRIGATYAPQPKPGVTSHRRKTLLKYVPVAGWPRLAPWVEYRNKNGRTERSSADAWFKWAGGEVAP